MHIEAQFEPLFLKFNRISAVDGLELRDEELEKFVTDPKWPRPGKSEFACFMSHQKCWKALLESNDDYAAVIEDDVVISKNAAPFLQGNDWIPQGVDLLKLETANMKAYYKRFNRADVNGRKLRIMTSFHYGTGGYIVSRGLAKDLLKSSENYIPAPIDHFLFDPDLNQHHGRVVFQLSPALCIQERFLSDDESALSGDIEERSVYDARMKNKLPVSAGKKILREARKGLQKLFRYPLEDRFIVPYK